MNLFELVAHFSVLAQAVDPPDKSLLDYIAEGRHVGFLIIGLSFTAVVLIVAQLVRLRFRHLAPPEHVARLDELLRSNDIDGAVGFCGSEETDSFLTRVMGAALRRCARSPFGFLELRSALEETGQQEVQRLQRSTEAIGLIASVAPMLGLLGTVIGIIGAFDTLRMSEGVARPDALAGDISVALITTAMGLIVAIPCAAVYAYLRSRIDQLAGEVGRVMEDLSAHVETVGSAQSAPKPAAAAQRPPPRPLAGEPARDPSRLGGGQAARPAGEARTA